MRTISTYILFSGRFAICCCLLFGNILFAGNPVPGFMFTENKGQLADPDGNVLDEVLYYGKGANLAVYFTADKLIFLEREDYTVESEESKKARSEGHNSKADELEARSKFYRFDLVFDGASATTKVEPSGAYEHHYNYFYGHCPDGIENVKSYSSLRYNNLYPGIDLVYRNDESGLKYEFIVHPGADPSLIKWHYEGLTGLQLKEDGSLEINGQLHSLADKAPVSFMESGKPVSSNFLNDNGQFSFELGSYPKNELLIIDPTLTWSTYFEAPSTTWDCISFTSTGGFFSAAYEYNATPPFFDAGTWYDNTHGGGTDILIVKFSNTGAQEWTTFYGGSSYEYHINNTGAVDDNDNFYLCGQTSSNNWPLYNPGGGAYYDGTYNSTEGFILKFSSNGTRLWSTYFGGSSGDRIRGVTTKDNYLYIVGETYSTDLPVQTNGSSYYDGTFGGGWDGFIARFNSNGVKDWCTYYGSVGYEDFVDVWIDPTNNNMYLTGQLGINSSSPSTYPTLPDPGGGAYYDNTVNGGTDVLIVKLNSSRQMVWATIYGGDKNDNINGDCGGVRTDSDGNIYVFGKTTSTNFPRQNPGGGAYYQALANGAATGNYDNDGFIIKFNSNGVRQWATYYGGAGSEEFRKVKIDLDDNIWVGSFTTSSDIPLLSLAGSYNQGYAGSTDALFIKFNQAGVRQWATCYGGSGSETCRPFGIFQSSACGLTMVALDYTSSTNLPLANPGGGAYYDNTKNGSSAVYILKMSEGGGGGAATGTITWTGAVNDDWFEPCNWDKTAVPTASNPVVIPAGTSNKPHINDNSKGNANCYTIEIESGSANGGHLYLNSSAGGRLNVTKP